MVKFIFKDSAAGGELALPVTPGSFQVSHGIKIETINIHTLGDVAVGGYGTLATVKIECFFPAQAYPFATAAALDPYKYVEKFSAWCDSRTVLRFVVSDTPVNLPVLVEEITYGEKDGTGDVYATITLHEYRELAVTQTDNGTGNADRPEEEAAPPPTMDTYVIVKGDTLWAISRKFYGDPQLCCALAKYNSIPNANLIYPDQVLQIPDKSLLGG